MKRQQPIFLVFLGVLSLFLCSCVMVDSNTKKSGVLDTSESAETFYVGQAGLKLFPEPRFSKSFIAALSLHEKVVRDKLEKGFAHVRVVRTGQTGWVNNAHLLWKVSPPPESVSTEPTPPPKSVPSESSPSAKSVPTVPSPSAESSQPEPTPEKIPSEENVIREPECPDPEREGRDAAIFNRF